MVRLHLLVLVLAAMLTCIQSQDPEYEGEGRGQATLRIIWETIEQIEGLIRGGVDGATLYEGGRMLAERTLTNVVGNDNYDIIIRLYRIAAQTCAADGGNDETLGTVLQERLEDALDAVRVTLQANTYTSFVVTYGGVMIRYFGRNRAGGVNPGPNPRDLAPFLTAAPSDLAKNATRNASARTSRNASARTRNASARTRNASARTRNASALVKVGSLVPKCMGLSSTLYTGTVGALGSVLEAGYELRSLNGRYRLTMQADGNFVFYDGDQPLWDSKTFSFEPLKALLFVTGELFVYSPATGAVSWRSETGCVNSGCAKEMVLGVHDDGVAMLYNPVTMRVEWVPPT